MAAELLSCHGMRDIKVVPQQPGGFLSLAKVFPHFFGGKKEASVGFPIVFENSNFSLAISCFH